MEFTFGVQKTKRIDVGRGKKLPIGTRSPRRNVPPTVSPGQEPVNTDVCPSPGSVPVEELTDEFGESTSALTVTQYERRRLAEDAIERQAELPEFIIMGTSISLFSYETLTQIGIKIENDQETGHGSVNDPRLGIIESNNICQTCYSDTIRCPGHLGYIDLNEPIYHPFFLKEIVQVLNCLCRSCSRLILTEEEIQEKGINKYALKDRLDMLEEASINSGCRRSSAELPGGKVVPCRKNYFFPTQKIKETHEVHYKRDKNDKETEILSIEEVKRILEAVPDEDASLLGFNVNAGSRPVNMILQALAVTPPITRYPTRQNGILRKHPITAQYIKIIKINNKLRTAKEGDRFDIRSNLFNAIQQLFENDKSTNFSGGKTLRSFKEQIQGKDSIIRGLLMGKKGNYIARTVLSPDPSLKFGQIRIPKIFASSLTRQETVCVYNKAALEELITERYVTVMEYLPGGLTPRPVKRKQRQATSIIYGPSRGKYQGKTVRLKEGKTYKLEYGDKVERYLRNGDMIVAGRQPTLHKHNLMAYEVVLGDELTIGLHLSVTTPNNADWILV